MVFLPSFWIRVQLFDKVTLLIYIGLRLLVGAAWFSKIWLLKFIGFPSSAFVFSRIETGELRSVFRLRQLLHTEIPCSVVPDCPL